MRDVLIKQDWFEEIKNAPKEIQMELFYRIIKYGCLEEEIDIENDDWSISNAWFNLKGHIDRMQSAHDINVENGKKNGRKMIANPQEVYDYCQSNPKAKINEIGKMLGLPASESSKGPYGYLYDNPGWKNRKIAGWIYGGSENFSDSDSDFGKKIPKTEFGKNSFSENSSEKPKSDSEKNSEKIPFEF